jgi:hypothetical protein
VRKRYLDRILMPGRILKIVPACRAFSRQAVVASLAASPSLSSFVATPLICPKLAARG